MLEEFDIKRSLKVIGIFVKTQKLKDKPAEVDEKNSLFKAYFLGKYINPFREAIINYCILCLGRSHLIVNVVCIRKLLLLLNLITIAIFAFVKLL
jgi:hypothetical protein